MRARLWAAVAAACMWGCDLSLVENTNIADADNDDRIEGTITGTEDGSDLVVGFACQDDGSGSAVACTWLEGPARANVTAMDGTRFIPGNIAQGESWDIVRTDAPTNWTICVTDQPDQCASVFLQS